MKNSKSKKLLGVTIDNKLNFNFNEYVNKLYDKANQKANALARVSSYMNIEKRKAIMKGLINSPFSYYPLT